MLSPYVLQKRRASPRVASVFEGSKTPEDKGGLLGEEVQRTQGKMKTKWHSDNDIP